jgi:hypothetical protein
VKTEDRKMTRHTNKLILIVALLYSLSNGQYQFVEAVGLKKTGSHQHMVNTYSKPFYARTLSGFISANAQNPISGARVLITDKDWESTIDETTTNQDGFFSFPNFKRGTYFLQISKEGFQITRLKIKVVARKNAPNELHLTLSLS